MKHPDAKRDLVLKPLEFEVGEAEPITTEKGYRHTLTSVEGLKRSLAEYQLRGGRDLEPGMRQLTIDGMQGIIDEWSQQARDYEALKNGQVSLNLRSLRELPLILVRARVAAGLTQKQLAEKLGIKAQQIQRYEATRYRPITLERMLEVADVLGVRLEGTLKLG